MKPDEKPHKQQESSKEQEGSSKEEEESSKNIKTSFAQKLLKGFKKLPIILMSVLFISVGGPIGIALGILLLLFAIKKPISKLVKQTLSYTKKKLYQNKKLKESQKKERKKLEEKSSLSVNKASLGKMSTRPNSVSKVNILPKENSKSTSNGFQPAASKFSLFTEPSISLSKKAAETRKRPAHIKGDLSPNLKRPKLAFK